MVNQKNYVTWSPFVISTSKGIHQLSPSASVEQLWPNISITELSFGRTATDKRMLAFIEYDDANFSAEALQRFWDGHKHLCLFELADPQTAVDLCNEWYPNDPVWFSLDADGFTIIDGRPPEDP